MVRFPNKSLSDQKMWSWWPWKVKIGFLWVFKIVLPGLYLVFWWYFKYFSTDFQNLNACQHLHLNAYLLALEWGHFVKKCGLQSLSKLPEIWFTTIADPPCDTCLCYLQSIPNEFLGLMDQISKLKVAPKLQIQV